jgi:nitrite reductase/ring-hydroxylating ferredoxin subunit
LIAPLNADVAEASVGLDESDARLCALSDIPDAGAIEIMHAGDSLIAIRYGDQAYVYQNICPHAGRALNWAPGKFLLSLGQLVCAAHGASFKPENGECIGGPCRGQSLTRIELSVRDGLVYIKSATTS